MTVRALSAPGSARGHPELQAWSRVARDRDDLHLALALHPFADGAEWEVLESVVFATRRRRLQVAAAAYAPDSVLARLAATRPDAKVRLRLARHPRTSGEALRGFLEDDDSEPLAAAAAAHPNLPAELIARLHVHGAAAVRRALCTNPSTGRDILARLAANAALDCLKWIARHPQADARMLEALWAVGDRYLRGEVTASARCPGALKERAMVSGDVLLRRKLASNPHAGVTRLLELLTDPAPQVRAAATGNAGLPASACALPIADPSRQVRSAQARREGLPVEQLDRLAADEDGWVRRWVARNPTTPVRILERLARDAVAQVRRAVARNPGAPVRLLEALAGDSEGWVRAGVAFRDDLAEKILVKLAEETDRDVLSGVARHPAAPRWMLERIARHRDKDVRRAVALNRHAPLAVLRVLLNDEYAMNRATLARHPALGEAEYRLLTEDPEPQVRFMATQMLARSWSAGSSGRGPM